jgi:acetoin utilization deacetylase AcuC-like enzyme
MRYGTEINEIRPILKTRPQDYQWIAAELKKIQPRIVSVLEGGYELETEEGKPGSLIRGTLAHIEGLQGNSPSQP